MALGFAQSMYALDAADGESGGGVVVANSLIQALLGCAVPTPASVQKANLIS